MNGERRGPELLCRAGDTERRCRLGGSPLAQGAVRPTVCTLQRLQGSESVACVCSHPHSVHPACGASSARRSSCSCVFTSAYVQGVLDPVTARACDVLLLFAAAAALLCPAHCTSWSSSRWKGFAQIATPSERMVPGSLLRAPVPRAAAPPHGKETLPSCGKADALRFQVYLHVYAQGHTKSRSLERITPEERKAHSSLINQSNSQRIH